MNGKYEEVTIARMQIHTSDCFTSVDGAALKPGDVDLPGLDAGTEENNELCRTSLFSRKWAEDLFMFISTMELMNIDESNSS